MSIIIPANSAVGGGIEGNSCRFNAGSSDFLNRTFGTPTNNKKYTYSTWVKRLDSEYNVLFNAGSSRDCLRFRGDNDRLHFFTGEATSAGLATNRVFRDPSAFYHIVLAVDTTQGTDTNRVKIYVNGVQETSFAVTNYPAQNYTNVINSAVVHRIAHASNSYDEYFAGYMAETVFIDGTQLAPTSFGQFNGDSGVWQPIDVSGLTFGNNGFYLDFEDSSALGNDAAGSNNWTTNNLTAIDQTTDSPTNNFATLNSIDNGYGTILFTEGNTRGEGSGSGWKPARGSMGVSSGKWYWEMNMTGSNQMGVSNETIDMDNDNSQDLVGVTVFYNASGGVIRTDGSQVGGTTATFAADGSDIAGYALDMDNKKLSIYKNGSIIVTNTALSTSITDFALPFFCVNGGGTWSVNFGNPSVALSSAVADGNGYGAFEYEPPSGYLALCTANLSEELS